MKCENCNVMVGAEFSHAIKNNQCPACGKGIMQQAKLASFLSLRTLLDDIPEKGVDADKIASLIIANFEIKQLFKEELQKVDEEGIMDVDEDEDEEVEVVEEVIDPDADFKANQKKEAKVVLRKMRDDALGGALKERYGLADDGLLLTDEDAGMHEVINKHKQDNSLSVVMMGTAPVRRSEP